jgi:ABC-type multidrug transport system fused ATPase/permease subunit
VLGSAIVFCTTCFALWRQLSDGLAALVIIQAGIFAEASRQLVKYVFTSFSSIPRSSPYRVGAQLELDFNSVERVSEYLDLPQEVPTESQREPPAYWPSSTGQVSIDGLVVRYAADGPDALKGISLSFKPSEKIGVVCHSVPLRSCAYIEIQVGRTGSGKSTLAMSFLRIMEPFQGRIVYVVWSITDQYVNRVLRIDGIDINSVGLDYLRNAIVRMDFFRLVRSLIIRLEDDRQPRCGIVFRHNTRQPGSSRDVHGSRMLGRPKAMSSRGLGYFAGSKKGNRKRYLLAR